MKRAASTWIEGGQTFRRHGMVIRSAVPAPAYYPLPEPNVEPLRRPWQTKGERTKLLALLLILGGVAIGVYATWAFVVLAWGVR